VVPRPWRSVVASHRTPIALLRATTPLGRQARLDGTLAGPGGSTSGAGAQRPSDLAAEAIGGKASIPQLGALVVGRRAHDGSEPFEETAAVRLA